MRSPRVLALAGLMLATNVSSSAGQATAPSRPDFSGYWELRLDSFNVPLASLTPEALSAAEGQAKKDAEALSRCLNVGMPSVMDDRAPLDIRQSPTVIGMVAKTQSSTRYIYIDGRAHPDKDELEGVTNGHSIGRWEGSTLVVDTVGFNDRGVTRIPGGGYRTPDSHLVERYRLIDDGHRLSVSFTWNDPGVFQRPHSYEFRYYKIRQVSEPRTFNCLPDPERTRFLTGAPAAK